MERILPDFPHLSTLRDWAMLPQPTRVALLFLVLVLAVLSVYFGVASVADAPVEPSPLLHAAM